MGNPDLLRTPSTVCTPDSRSPKLSFLTHQPLTVEYQHEAVVEIVLHQNVPENIRIQFETTKNLYLYAWFVFRFYPVAELHAYTCLEFALRMRFGDELIKAKIEDLESKVNKLEASGKSSSSRIRKQLKKIKEREFGPGLSELLIYVVEGGFLKDENFSIWQQRTVARAKRRTGDEIWEEAQRNQLNEISYDENQYEIKEVDRDHKYLETIFKTIPWLRNHYAHGTHSLNNQVLSTLSLVAEIINQIYPEKPLMEQY